MEPEATLSNANKKAACKPSIPVPEPRGASLNAIVRKSDHSLADLHSPYTYAGIWSVKQTRADGSTHIGDHWWSGLNPILLGEEPRAQSATSEAMSAKELKRQANAARPTTKWDRNARMREVAGLMIGCTLQDIVRSLRPFGSKHALVNLGTKLARQADAALGSCYVVPTSIY